jgi:site-specific recombinase XerD
MAKSKAYQAAADAPATLRAYKATLRAYKTDLENFKAWFKSPRQVQRFLFTHDQIANVFARRPNQDTAAKFHSPPRSFIPPATKPSPPGLR